MPLPRNRKVFTGLTMASSLAWMSILPATAVFAQSTPTVTPGSVTLSGPITPTNGTATFTASASDPNGTAEYQFWVESPNGAWTDMQNFSTNNTFTLSTPSAGDYLVAVEVMDQAQVAAGDWSMAQTTLPDGVFNGSSLSVMSNASGSVAAGTQVTLTATETNVFSPLYQFWYQEPNGTWVQSGNYQSSNTFTFTASQSGTYKYVAYVKSPLAANNPHGALASNVGTQVAYGTASQVVLSVASPTVVANGSATDLLTATVEDS
ncbi:MAG: regulator, partial [Thermaerobacter sp.]|nr:regulator [Thermaerobacter sp.]